MTTFSRHTSETENRNIERNPHPSNSVPSPYPTPPLILPLFHDTYGSVVSLSMCDVVPLHSFPDLCVFSHHALCFLPISPGHCLWCCPLRWVTPSSVWNPPISYFQQPRLPLLLNLTVYLELVARTPRPEPPQTHHTLRSSRRGGEEIIFFKLNNTCLKDRKDLSVWIPHISYF